VSVTSANQLSLQELTQVTTIKLLISGFLEIFASLSEFPGGNARLAPPCGRLCQQHVCVQHIAEQICNITIQIGDFFVRYGFEKPFCPLNTCH